VLPGFHSHLSLSFYCRGDKGDPGPSDVLVLRSGRPRVPWGGVSSGSNPPSVPDRNTFVAERQAFRNDVWRSWPSWMSDPSFSTPLFVSLFSLTILPLRLPPVDKGLCKIGVVAARIGGHPVSG